MTDDGLSRCSGRNFGAWKPWDLGVACLSRHPFALQCERGFTLAQGTVCLPILRFEESQMAGPVSGLWGVGRPLRRAIPEPTDRGDGRSFARLS